MTTEIQTLASIDQNTKELLTLVDRVVNGRGAGDPRGARGDFESTSESLLGSMRREASQRQKDLKLKDQAIKDTDKLNSMMKKFAKSFKNGEEISEEFIESLQRTAGGVERGVSPKLDELADKALGVSRTYETQRDVIHSSIGAYEALNDQIDETTETGREAHAEQQRSWIMFQKTLGKTGKGLTATAEIAEELSAGGLRSLEVGVMRFARKIAFFGALLGIALDQGKKYVNNVNAMAAAGMNFSEQLEVAGNAAKIGMNVEEYARLSKAIRHTEYALGGHAAALDTIKSVSTDVGTGWRGMFGSLQEAGQGTAEMLHTLEQSGVRSGEMLQSDLYSGFTDTLQALHSLGMGFEESRQLIEEITKTSAFHSKIISAATQQERRQIMLNIVQRQREWRELGLTAEQAKRTAEALDEIKGKKATDRFAEAAKLQAAMSAMGIGGGTRAAELVRMGKRRGTSGDEELRGFYAAIESATAGAETGPGYSREMAFQGILESTGLDSQREAMRQMVPLQEKVEAHMAGLKTSEVATAAVKTADSLAVGEKFFEIGISALPSIAKDIRAFANKWIYSDAEQQMVAADSARAARTNLFNKFDVGVKDEHLKTSSIYNDYASEAAMKAKAVAEAMGKEEMYKKMFSEAVNSGGGITAEESRNILRRMLDELTTQSDAVQKTAIEASRQVAEMKRQQRDRKNQPQ